MDFLWHALLKHIDFIVIKNLILDLGGVLFDIDYLLSAKALVEFSTQPELITNLTLQSFIDIPVLFEKGLISAVEFKDFLINKYKLNCSENQFNDAWNKMLIKLDDNAFDFVKSLIKMNKSVVLLSNTNIIHYNYFYPVCEELFKLLDKTYFSFEIGLRKPEIEIYNLVCNEMGYKFNETLFVDDSLVNINAAQSADLNAIHFTNDISLSDILHTVNFSLQY